MTITTNKTLILASSSPRRQELIRSLQLPVLIQASDVDETTEPGLTPMQIVEQLSTRKALAVFKHYKAESAIRDAIVIGSDTIVVMDGQVLGKPANEADAFRMLNLLQGKEHQVYTGLACIDLAAEEPKDHPMGEYGKNVQVGSTGQYRILSESTKGCPEAMVGHIMSKVTFSPMSDEEIRGYIRTGEPSDKAGAYGVQGAGAIFIEKIEGDFHGVMGLPLNLLYQMLLKVGIGLFEN